MARTYFTGFEVADGNANGVGRVDITQLGSGCSWETTIHRGNGQPGSTRSLKVVAASGTQCIINLFRATANSPYLRFYIRVTVRPATTARPIYGATSSLHIDLNPNGTLSVVNNTTPIGTSTTALTDTARWYMVELRISNGSSVTVLQIDGIAEVTGSPSSWSISNFMGAAGTVADTYTAYFDDFSQDNSAFPGPGNVVLLLPISDSSITNWTAGAGAGSSLFEAINNLPPAGVASASETNTTNIESSSNSGTASYSANMNYLADLGAQAGATIVALEQLVVHGEDIATGAKTGSFELASNPVVGATAFTFGEGDSGAHVAYADAASNWKLSSLVTTTPSMDINSVTNMRLVKTDTTTRTGCVCFMGIYVEYVPAATVTPPNLPKVIRQAVSRASYR